MGKLIRFLFLVGRYVVFPLHSTFISPLLLCSSCYSFQTIWFSTRPVRVTLARQWNIQDIGIRANNQAKELDKLRKNRGKPLDGRPVPF